MFEMWVSGVMFCAAFVHWLDRKNFMGFVFLAGSIFMWYQTR